MKKTYLSGLAIAVLTVTGSLIPSLIQAQEVPARFYLKSLSGANAVPVIYKSMSGNTNPFDPASFVTPNANFDATMTMVGYAKSLPVMDRAAMVAFILPMGRISGEVNAGGITASQSTKGFGDPMAEFDINLIGPPAQKDIPAAMRYEPGFSLDALADLALPIGEYDNDKSLNIGQNRWYGRVGFPMTWQIDAWIPGQRTTFELLPAAWIFGDNDDFMGQTMETDPMYRLDAHLTRDFTERLWGSLDASWYNGGKATINGVAGDKISSTQVGLTLGYAMDDNINLTVGYMSTINDDAPGEMSMDSFMLTFVYGWHPIIEGSKRLKQG
jgi:hypothetical protein